MTTPTPELCSCSALRQASRHVTRFYDEALAPAGIGVNQYAILAKLDRFGPHHLQDLADLLIMDRSTLGHLLKPLAARGWISIDVSADDRRHRVIALTQAGRACVTMARPLWAAAEDAFQRAFGENDAADLRITLKRVASLSPRVSRQ